MPLAVRSLHARSSGALGVPQAGVVGGAARTRGA